MLWHARRKSCAFTWTFYCRFLAHLKAGSIKRGTQGLNFFLPRASVCIMQASVQKIFSLMLDWFLKWSTKQRSESGSSKLTTSSMACSFAPVLSFFIVLNSLSKCIQPSLYSQGSKSPITPKSIVSEPLLSYPRFCEKTKFCTSFVGEFYPCWSNGLGFCSFALRILFTKCCFRRFNKGLPPSDPEIWKISTNARADFYLTKLMWSDKWANKRSMISAYWSWQS